MPRPPSTWFNNANPLHCAGKKIAHCIKCTFAPKPISTVAPKPYSKQFYEHFAQNFTGKAGLLVQCDCSVTGGRRRCRACEGAAATCDSPRAVHGAAKALCAPASVRGCAWDGARAHPLARLK